MLVAHISREQGIINGAKEANIPPLTFEHCGHTINDFVCYQNRVFYLIVKKLKNKGLKTT